MNLTTTAVAPPAPGAKLPSAVGALPGIGLVALLALLALEIGKAPWLQANGISALRLQSCSASSSATRCTRARSRRRGRDRVLEADVAAFRDHSLRAAPYLSGHRERRLRRRDHRCARAEQHLHARLVGWHPRFRTRSQDRPLDRGWQLDLRRGGHHGGRARGAGARRAGRGGRLDGRGVRDAGDLSLPGALPLERALPAFVRHPRPLRDLRRLDHSRGGASRGGRPCRDGCGRQYGGDHQDGARHDARALSHHRSRLICRGIPGPRPARAPSAHPSSPSSPPRSAASSFPGSRSGSWPWRRSTRFWSCLTRW